MTVSIIIPVYNVSDYVERCLQSVMEQSYQDIECILVDDHTPDDSIEKCQRMVDDYRGPIQFKILHHEHNRGLSAARNTGTVAARGDYIYYLDSDDEITPDCIEIMAKEVEIHPEVEMVMANLQTIPYKANFDKPIFKKPGYIDSNKWVRYNFFRSGWTFPVMAWNKLIKHSFIEDNHLSFKEGLIHEDELWIFFVIKKLKRLAIVNHPTYIYYTTDNSIMAKTSKILSAKHKGIILAHISRNMDEPFFSLQLYRYLSNYIDNFHYARFSSNYWIAMPRFLTGLLKDGKKKLAVLFFTYIILSPFFCWQRLRNIIFNHVTSLWAIASREAGKSFI